MPNAEEVARQIAVHEAVCAERWKHVSSRLGRIAKHHFYRKTALFDRFLSFDVTLEGATASRH